MSHYLSVVKQAEPDLRRQMKIGLINRAEAVTAVLALESRIQAGDRPEEVEQDLIALLEQWPATRYLIYGSTRGSLGKSVTSLKDLADAIHFVKNVFVVGADPISDDEVAYECVIDADIRQMASPAGLAGEEGDRS